MIGELSEPVFSGEVVRRAWNALAPGDRAHAVGLLLRAAHPHDKGRERDEFLRRAARVCARVGQNHKEIAAAFRARMEQLSATAFPSFLDAGTEDGLLCCALLVWDMAVPSLKTFERALEQDPL